ncbi:metallophosphoesterase family protein [Corynebacterium uterequi]|uniref:Calcineurin-like phosphoesterase n=1 Tax=Corynebacterium uterequi TaxID=1072256 RepID=A0A0G3HFN7_9CORY|nr:metallophosphoesterase [Corynebacterium uterequi]AKK10758.1 Calcineurin-like phosphoesterase [Corynebacterium uterequi]
MSRRGLALTTVTLLSLPLVSCAGANIAATAASSSGASESSSAAESPTSTATVAPVSGRTEGLLTDPFLQLPGDQQVNVAWFTETEGAAHAVLTGDIDALDAAAARKAVDAGVDGVNVFAADTMKLSRMFEDAKSFVESPPAESEGIVARDVFRHEATVTGLDKTDDTPYRVVSIDGDDVALSEVFTANDEYTSDEDLTMLLTSDHQQKDHSPANLQWAVETIGGIDVALVAGDLINVPDRASEWFDDSRGLAYFEGMQGNANYTATNGETYHGGEILQNAHSYPVIGNHEVMGRIDGQTSLDSVFNNPVPRKVAEAEYEKVAQEVNPGNSPEVKDKWIEDNSFSTTSYEEIFSLPESAPGGEKYYATTIGNTRLISLYSTRIWRSEDAEPDPAKREKHSRYQDAAASIGKPLERGYGDFVFEDIAVGSQQYDWLKKELTSKETSAAEHVIVMLHESPVSNGKNVMPHFGNPVVTEEKDDAGKVIGYRYDYPEEGNILLTSLLPLVDAKDSPVDLVFNGHSHLWNRFQSDNGVNFLETSNVGNSYGFYGPLSTDGSNKDGKRNQPPAPWTPENVLEQGNPAGLEAITPTENPLKSLADSSQDAPFVASNDYSVFTSFDTATGEVTSWIFDGTTPGAKPEKLDVFTLAD